MKKFFLLTLAGFITFSAFSQSKGGGTNLSGGLELGLPTGDMNLSQNIGFGASVKALFGDVSGFTASAGYMTFSGKNTIPAFSAIPVKVGYRTAFEGGFYFEPQVGMSFTSQGGFTESVFTYAPNVGIITGGLDISARYEAMTKDSYTIGFIGLRLAFSIGKK